MNDRKYLIIPTTELNKVVFKDILETGENTLLYSGDGKRTFIKWSGDDPAFISTLVGAEGPYNHTEIKEIIKDDAWLSTKKSRKKVT